MRLFHLERDVDETGISGTGRIAEGVVFSNGAVAMTWLTSTSSYSIYKSIFDVDAIHGHNGKTRIVYDS